MKTKTIWAIVIVIVIIAIIVYFYNSSDKKRNGGSLRKSIVCSPPCPQGKYCNTQTGECKPPIEVNKFSGNKGNLNRQAGGSCSKTYTYTDVYGVKQSNTCTGYYDKNEDCICSGYGI